ncbi:MAG: hypothetical protein GC192_20850 [Bacteroidetes bacterium]|nr:hypothetical protein [Bacteroidota bacterium]
MKNRKIEDLFTIISSNPDSKESKIAKAELDFIQTSEMIKYNKRLSAYTIIVCLATVVQALAAVINLYLVVSSK